MTLIEKNPGRRQCGWVQCGLRCIGVFFAPITVVTLSRSVRLDKRALSTAEEADSDLVLSTCFRQQANIGQDALLLRRRQPISPRMHGTEDEAMVNDRVTARPTSVETPVRKFSMTHKPNADVRRFGFQSVDPLSTSSYDWARAPGW
jgi:hypothetical protein